MKRKKFFRMIIVALIVCVLMVPLTVKKVRGNDTTRYIKVTVYPGDTLWKIAKSNNVEKIDVRKLIYKIRKLNKLESANIMPGQQIVIPVK